MIAPKPRTALVTGAGSGIGSECAEWLLARGHRVVAVDVRVGRMAARADDLHAVVELDVADTAAVDAIDGIDEVDIVVQCAAIGGPSAPLTELSMEDWDRIMAVNVAGVVNVMRAALPGMMRRGWGRVVNVASIAGKEGDPGLSAYSASKGAVIALTKSVAKELATTGVLVSCVAPTVTDTPMIAGRPRECSTGWWPRSRWAGYAGPPRSPRWSAGCARRTAPSAPEPATTSPEAGPPTESRRPSLRGPWAQRPVSEANKSGNWAQRPVSEANKSGNWAQRPVSEANKSGRQEFLEWPP